MKLILNREFENFYIIEVWDDKSLASPISFEKIASLWNMLSDNGCAFLALVTSNELQKLIASKMVPDIGKVFSNKVHLSNLLSCKKLIYKL